VFYYQFIKEKSDHTHTEASIAEISRVPRFPRVPVFEVAQSNIFQLHR